MNRKKTAAGLQRSRKYQVCYLMVKTLMTLLHMRRHWLCASLLIDLKTAKQSPH